LIGFVFLFAAIAQSTIIPVCDIRYVHINKSKPYIQVPGITLRCALALPGTQLPQPVIPPEVQLALINRSRRNVSPQFIEFHSL